MSPLGPLVLGAELAGIYIQGANPRPQGGVLTTLLRQVPLPRRRRIRGPVPQGLLRYPRELPAISGLAITPEHSRGPGINHQDLLRAVAAVSTVGVSHLLSYDLVPSW